MSVLADEIFREFREHSVSEFFRRNAAMLGYTGKIRSLTTIVHEMVTNSIDACEEAGILPDIKVKIEKLDDDPEHLKVTVEDNGPGIPERFIPNVFGKMLAGTKLHRNVQQRGQQGIGVCLPYESIIPLSNGSLVPIGELVENPNSGSKVLSYNPNKARAVFGKIVNRVKNQPSTRFVKLTTYGGLSLTATPDHLVPVWDGAKKRTLRAAEINEGMFLRLGLAEIPGNQRPVYTYKILDPNKYRVYDRRAVLELLGKLKNKYGSVLKIAKKFGVPKERIRGWTRQRLHAAHPTISEFVALAKGVDHDEEKIAEDISVVGLYHHRITIQPKLDEELCWFMGLLASDGHIGEYAYKCGTSMSISNSNHMILKKARTVLEGLGVHHRSYVHKGRHFHFASSILVEIAHRFGIPSGRKSKIISFSRFALELPVTLLASFLRGLFDGDGSISHHRHRVNVSYSTASETFVRQLQLILLTRFGIFASVSELKRKKRRYYRLVIESREFLKKFIEQIGFTDHPYLQELREYVKQPLRGASNFCKKIDDEYLVKIRRSEILYLPQTPTYDLSIDEHPFFIANGIVVHNSGSVMYGQITSGRPTAVTTSTGNGEVVSMEVTIDVDKNEGRIQNRKVDRRRWQGTKAEIEPKEVVYVRSRYGPFNYLRMTAIANPHVRITFIEPDNTRTVFERAANEVPSKPKLMPLHPKGVGPDDLLVLAKQTKSRTVGGLLVWELSRMTKRKIEEVRKFSGVNLDKKPAELTWEEAEKIVSAFKRMKFMAPSTEGLRPIGAPNVEHGMRQILAPEFVHAITRQPKVYRGGIPFAVDCGIAYGGGAGRAEEGEGEVGGIEFIRFANRAPLIFDQGGCSITAAAKSIDWRRYGVDPASSPMTLFINISSAYVPYTSAGKQSVAEEPEIYEEVRGAIMDVARELKRHLYRKIRIKERQQRAGVFEQYLPVIAKKAAALAEVEEPDVRPLLEKIAKVENAEES